MAHKRTRSAEKRPAPARKAPKPPLTKPGRGAAWTAAGIFGLALLLRLLFLHATPDVAWPHSALYKGDAPTWLAYAAAIEQGESFDQGLPLRPPGNAYLLVALGGSHGEPTIERLERVWCLLGALTVLVLYLAVRRSFGPAPAFVVGLLGAASHGLMVLTTSLNNETPYLLLVALLLWAWPRVADHPRLGILLIWGALNALACLFRVEHALFFGLTSIYLALFPWRAGGPGLPWRWRVAAVAVIFVAVLVPWHLHAWQGVRDFNRHEPAPDPRTEAMFTQLENALAHITWSAEAETARQALPAVSRRTMTNFVAATVAVRGGQTVTREAFSEILEGAFGTVPRPLGEFPFITLYGGLNFYLANHQGALPGFGRGPLDLPPPLVGGASRYPAMLVAGLPPPDLALSYPPHLQIVNDGYRLGLRWIIAHPADAAALAVQKLGVFWSGATLGFGGSNLPFTNAGLRRRVDLTVPEGQPWLPLWRLLWLSACGGGLWLARRNPALFPWLAYLLTKIVATVAFFGYARQGASAIPVIALLIALVIDLGFSSLTPEPTRARLALRLIALTVVLLIAAEGIRTLYPPTLEIDGQAITATDPWPLDLHEDRRIRVGGAT